MRLSQIIIILLLFCFNAGAQTLKKTFKFSTFYVAANGGTSLADRDIYSTNQGLLSNDTVFTPYD